MESCESVAVLVARRCMRHLSAGDQNLLEIAKVVYRRNHMLDHIVRKYPLKFRADLVPARYDEP